MRMTRVVELSAALLALLCLAEYQILAQEEVVYRVAVGIPNRKDAQNRKYVYALLIAVVLGNAVIGTRSRNGAAEVQGIDNGGNGNGNGPVPTG